MFLSYVIGKVGKCEETYFGILHSLPVMNSISISWWVDDHNADIFDSAWRQHKKKKEWDTWGFLNLW